MSHGIGETYESIGEADCTAWQKATVRSAVLNFMACIMSLLSLSAGGITSKPSMLYTVPARIAPFKAAFTTFGARKSPCNTFLF